MSLAARECKGFCPCSGMYAYYENYPCYVKEKFPPSSSNLDFSHVLIPLPSPPFTPLSSIFHSLPFYPSLFLFYSLFLPFNKVTFSLFNLP